MLQLLDKNFQDETNLPFFAKEIYLKSKSDNYGWIINEDFIIPFIIFKKMIFKRMIFTTEVIYRKENLSIEKEKEFLNSVVSFIKEKKLCDFIHKPQPSAVFNTYPDNCDSFKWGTYQIETSTNLNEMIKRVSKSQRNYINRAIKDGVTVEKTDNMEKVYELCNETLDRQKIQLLICYDELKVQKELFKDDMLLFKVKYNDEIQGTLIVFKDNKTAYAEYAGSIIRPKKGSLKLLHLTAMQYLAEEHGIKTYDFIGAIPDIIEGTKEAGIQKFKKEFGTTLKEGYQFSLIISPIKYFMFNLCLHISFRKKGIKYKDPIKKFKELSKSQLKV